MSDPVLTADILIPMGSAMLGAIVGGGASALGSRWVARSQLSRQYRIRVYDKTLPAMRARLVKNRDRYDNNNPLSAQTLEGLDELLRAAIVAGARDQRYARSIIDLTTTYESTRDGFDDWKLNPANIAVLPDAQDANLRMRAQNERILREVDEFSSWLGDRISQR